MTKKISITGASDDLIEVTGDITEEWNPPLDEADAGVLLAVSDGTLLRVVYDSDGIWRITRIIAGTAEYEKKEGDVEEDAFDVVTLIGDIKWVALATNWAK